MKNGGVIGFLSWCFIILIGLNACSFEQENYAPVTHGWSSQSASNTYRVQPDDTLYSIAFRFGEDYRKLAEMNNLTPPYNLASGQRLILSSQGSTPVLSPNSDEVVTGGAPASAIVSQSVSTINSPSTNSISTTNNSTVNPTSSPIISVGPKSTAVVIPAQSVVVPASTSTSIPTKTVTATSGKWLWPVNGKIINHFSAAYGGNKGIDIAGKLGAPVIATSSGRVVYSGTGLKGYGLLIIIKHNAEYLSAYAHNSKAFVKEGDTVSAGQKIALMGSSGSSKVLLHFEVRKAGKPIDPLSMLPPK